MVVVVALAMVLMLVGLFLTSSMGPRTGWSGYAPLEAGPFGARDGLTSGANLLVWIGLVLGWLAGSLGVLRSKKP